MLKLLSLFTYHDWIYLDEKGACIINPIFFSHLADDYL